jgi:hypothetical protein
MKSHSACNKTGLFATAIATNALVKDFFVLNCRKQCCHGCTVQQTMIFIAEAIKTTFVSA